MLISFCGAAGSGKTSLAKACVEHVSSEINPYVAYVEEYARTFIQQLEHPDHAAVQYHILKAQHKLEEEALHWAKYSFVDTSTIFSYIYPKTYSSTNNKMKLFILNDLKKEVLESSKRYDHIFYLPLRDDVEDDGVRLPEDSPMLDIAIRAFIKEHEQLDAKTTYLPEGLSVADSVSFVLSRLGLTSQGSITELAKTV